MAKSPARSQASNIRFVVLVFAVALGAITYLDAMLAEPFDAFAFSPASASVYQLGGFGAARKELKAFS